MTDLTLVFRSLKGRCHDKQFGRWIGQICCRPIHSVHGH